ncbi:NAD-dependent histone deacetylase sir2 [Malassezia sp. CBS 17886]|nr:NAD-dependent histone deacetylase sir2 [Malassezia sp. CBS 17886]
MDAADRRPAVSIPDGLAAELALDVSAHEAGFPALAAPEEDVDSSDLERLEEAAEQEMLEDMAREENGGLPATGEGSERAEGAPYGGAHARRAPGGDAASTRSSPESDAGCGTAPDYGPLPPEYVAEVLADLRRHGLAACMRMHILPDVSRILPLVVSLGVMLPRAVVAAAQTDPLSFLPLLRSVLAKILRQRVKLPQYNTVQDALALLERSRNIVVLCGAGISVSCGIPDFRSKDGIYALLAEDEQYQLDDPSDMFDKEYFLQDPSLFYSFAYVALHDLAARMSALTSSRSIYPENFEPSPSHHFIRRLEQRGKLLRLYTQNIDTLERKAGIERVVQCHGSFASATCTDPCCGHTVDGRAIRDDIFAQRVPMCGRCAARRVRTKRKRAGSDDDSDNGCARGVLKPDITFFGEKLSDAFERTVREDREKVDLVVVMGTSLKVAPVSDLLLHMPASTPVVLVNRTPILHMAMDVMLLGDSDEIVRYLERELGWERGSRSAECRAAEGSPPAAPSATRTPPTPERVADSHVWKFPGASGGWYVEELEAEARTR